MIRMSTLRTAVDLAPTRLRVDVLACEALLRAVRSGYEADRSAGPSLLVAGHPPERRPSRICDSTCAVPTHHPRNVQVLQYNDTVTLGVSCRVLVRKVMPSSSDLAVLSHDIPLGFCLVLGSFFSTVDFSLGSSESFQRSFQVPQTGDQLSVRSACEVDDAAIDRDRGTCSWDRIWDRNFANDRCEPLVPVTNERASLGCTFEWPMDDCTDLPELGEVER